jgi:hypothetical protein
MSVHWKNDNAPYTEIGNGSAETAHRTPTKQKSTSSFLAVNLKPHARHIETASRQGTIGTGISNREQQDQGESVGELACHTVVHVATAAHDLLCLIRSTSSSSKKKKITVSYCQMSGIIQQCGFSNVGPRWCCVWSPGSYSLERALRCGSSIPLRSIPLI